MKINRKELIDVLKSVEAGLDTRELLKNTQSFMFAGTRVHTYNDMVSVSADLPKGVELTGSVKATEMLHLLSKTPDEVVDLSMEAAELLLTTPKSRAGIVREAEVPNYMEHMGMPETWIPIPDGLMAAVTMCHFSCSHDCSKPLLNNVLIRGKQVVSSDDFRITVQAIKEGLGSDDVLIPSSLVRDISNHSPVEYGVTPGWNHLRNNGGAVFSFRALDGKYADVNKFLKFDGKALHMPEGLAEGVGRAKEVLDPKASSQLVTLAVKGGTLLMSAKGPFAWFKERYKVATSDELTFNINPDFLISALQHDPKFVVGERALRIEGADFTHIVLLIVIR